VLFDLVEEIIPSTNQTTLGLVVHQLQFVASPYLAHLEETNSRTGYGFYDLITYRVKEVGMAEALRKPPTNIARQVPRWNPQGRKTRPTLHVQHLEEID
jgi:hypothetical protein